MSLTVNGAFATFHKDFVNLDPERTKVARGSRDWLFDQLIGLPQKVDTFPHLYADKHIYYGSFARNTKIRELDDIDLILAFLAQGTKYQIIVPGKEYVLTPPESATHLRKLCHDDGTLNSIKVVNLLVASLDKIEHYKKSEKHRNQEAATLQLSSHEWKFDIVPAFFADIDHYVIPDGKGNWKPTDPRVDQEKVQRVNGKHGGKILQLIRTLKFWNRRGLMTTAPSYLFENMILDYFDNQAEVHDYIDFNLRDFWGYLITGIYYDVMDPKNLQGNLNTLSHSERESISAKAADAYARAAEAIKLEVTDGDMEASIRKWREIFGTNFI
ncbi:MAG TPA: nucleotidyltransferase [Candidatus Paceibacterota bacterium]|jgi:hypothetical protein